VPRSQWETLFRHGQTTGSGVIVLEVSEREFQLNHICFLPNFPTVETIEDGGFLIILHYKSLLSGYKLNSSS
jgi:hypothetical protein